MILKSLKMTNAMESVPMNHDDFNSLYDEPQAQSKKCLINNIFEI